MMGETRRAPAASAGPEGFVLVPREPTEEMVQKAIWQSHNYPVVPHGFEGQAEPLHHFVAICALRSAIAVGALAAPAATPRPEPDLHPADDVENFLRAAIDGAPAPLRRLGCYLADVLDEDQFKTAERMLLGGITAPTPRPEPTPRPAEIERLTTATSDVLAERRRQVEVEGWTPEHDDTHSNGELAIAAACYAVAPAHRRIEREFVSPDTPRMHFPFKQRWNELVWPWKYTWWKPAFNRRRNLVKAGALILAEIERLDRAALSAAQGDQPAGDA